MDRNDDYARLISTQLNGSILRDSLAASRAEIDALAGAAEAYEADAVAYRAEIERQRLELGITEDACAMLESEVLELRAEVDRYRHDAELADEVNCGVAAENAGLRAEVERLSDCITSDFFQRVTYRQQARDAQAEVERLRAALHAICELDSTDKDEAGPIAYAALYTHPSPGTSQEGT